MSGWISPYSETQIAELAERYRDGKFLFRLDAATPILICTGRKKIVHDSETYVPKDFTYEDMPLGGLATVTIANGDAALSAQKLTEGSFGGFEAKLVWYLKQDDGSLLEIGERIFSVRNCVWNVEKFRVNLKEEVDIRRKSGLQLVSAHCDLPFKGTLCGYSGGDTRCLKTYDDCLSKSNQTQFRGFRFCPHAGFRLNLDSTHYIYVPAHTSPGPETDPGGGYTWDYRRAGGRRGLPGRGYNDGSHGTGRYTPTGG